MFDLDHVLVIDGSRVVRELLARLLRRHSTVTHSLDHCTKAREWIRWNAVLSLIVVDRDAPGGGGFSVLEFVSSMRGPRPSVILTGRQFDEADRVRAEGLGAIACLTKPLSYQAIAQAVAASQERPFTAASPRLYAEPPARAHLLDPQGDESQIVWNLHDLSISGALIDTRGSIPVGTSLSLSLDLHGERIEVDCEVVRVQEPAWDTLPGVAVRFVDLGAEQCLAIERQLRGGQPRRRQASRSG